MMLQLAALTLFAITLATSAHATEAITFPTMDLNCFAWCIGYRSQGIDPQLFAGRPFGGEGAAAAIGGCDDHDCASRESDDRPQDTQQADRYSGTAISSDDYLEAKAFDVNIQIRDADISRDASRCTNVGSDAEASGPKPRDDNCSNVQPGADYSDTISILIIALITVLTLAAITFTWVMRRSYRIWRVRKGSAAARSGGTALLSETDKARG
jgi:hypothetical protein